MKLNDATDVFADAVFKSEKAKKALKIAAYAGLIGCVFLLLPPMQKILASSAYISLPFAALVVFVFVLCCLYAEYLCRFFKNSALITVLTIIVLIFTLGFTGVFSFINSWRWVDSDHASEMILGKLLAQENALVSSNWYYSTEIRLIYQTIFTMPLFKLLGSYENWALIRSLNIVLNNIVLIAAYFFMMCQFKVQKKWIFITALFLVMPLTYDYFNILTFGGYYTFFIAQVFLCLGLFVKLTYRISSVKKALLTFILLSIFLFALGAQTIRSLFVIHIPLFITCIFLQRKAAQNKNLLLLLGFGALILGCAGYIINCLLHLKFSFYSFDSIRMENPVNYFQKFGLSLVMLANFFGVSTGSSVISAYGFFSIAAIAAAFILFFYVFRLAKKYNSIPLRPAARQIWFFMPVFFAFAALFNIFVFTASERAVIFRYYIPFMVLYIPLTALAFEYCEKVYGGKKRIAVICGILLFILGRGFLGFQSLSVRDSNSYRRGYIQYLLDNNLEYGFASFWDANVTTELTNGKVETASIEQVRPGSGRNLFKIQKLLIPVQFLDPLYHTGESFILLKRNEWDMTRNRMSSSSRPTPDYEDLNFVILRFPSAQAVHNEFLELE